MIKGVNILEVIGVVLPYMEHSLLVIIKDYGNFHSYVKTYILEEHVLEKGGDQIAEDLNVLSKKHSKKSEKLVMVLRRRDDFFFIYVGCSKIGKMTSG